jgi:hypothetical protein
MGHHALSSHARQTKCGYRNSRRVSADSLAFLDLLETRSHFLTLPLDVLDLIAG